MPRSYSVAILLSMREGATIGADLDLGAMEEFEGAAGTPRCHASVPLPGSNQDSSDPERRPQASKTDKLTGSGVPTSIGALSV